MKRFLLAILIVLLPALASALDVPQLRGYVNDYAGILSAGTVRQLEETLAGFERSDSTQVVVLTVPSLEGDDLEMFSIRVAEAWRIGQKGKDN
ncbi:methanol dehydrogenase, partial [bacterium]|nr:methanol dehydrogenase [bacterium]